MFEHVGSVCVNTATGNKEHRELYVDDEKLMTSVGVWLVITALLFARDEEGE